MSFKNLMTAIHYRPGSLWARLLSPFAAVYGLVVTARLRAYEKQLLKSHPPGLPVISVGNLTTGGTGKTPIVIEIAQGLVKAGKTVLILSRGYGARRKVAYARATSPDLGDEAYLIQQRVPEAVVIVGPDRVKNLQRARQEYHPDYVILDDGYQHLRLGRSVNILLVDGEHLFGNGRLLPAGPLREPLSEIRRADMVFVTKSVSTEAMQAVEAMVRCYGSNPAPTIMPVPFQVAGLRNVAHDQILKPELYQSRPVVAVSAIAQPGRFEQDLRDLGVDLIQHHRFSDHHNYRPLDIETILYGFGKQPEKPWLVTTEKDLVKLQPLLPDEVRERLCTLQIAPALDGLWFYHEFLTQMHAVSSVPGSHAQPSGPAR